MVAVRVAPVSLFDNAVAVTTVESWLRRWFYLFLSQLLWLLLMLPIEWLI